MKNKELALTYYWFYFIPACIIWAISCIVGFHWIADVFIFSSTLCIFTLAHTNPNIVKWATPVFFVSSTIGMASILFSIFANLFPTDTIIKADFDKTRNSIILYDEGKPVEIKDIYFYNKVTQGCDIIRTQELNAWKLPLATIYKIKE